MNKAINYVKETKAELKGVIWPSRRQTITYTLLVVGASLAVAVLLGFFDMISAYLLEKFVL
ncbi:MAG: preprotein translocase subunit SecE [Candidatus Paceibacter sp.]|nr:preprotein translocase subunit SecE [Candidatus Paceibacter sp.]